MEQEKGTNLIREANIIAASSRQQLLASLFLARSPGGDYLYSASKIQEILLEDSRQIPPKKSWSLLPCKNSSPGCNTQFLHTLFPEEQTLASLTGPHQSVIFPLFEAGSRLPYLFSSDTVSPPNTPFYDAQSLPDFSQDIALRDILAGALSPPIGSKGYKLLDQRSHPCVLYDSSLVANDPAFLVAAHWRHQNYHPQEVLLASFGVQRDNSLNSKKKDLGSYTTQDFMRCMIIAQDQVRASALPGNTLLFKLGSQVETAKLTPAELQNLGEQLFLENSAPLDTLLLALNRRDPQKKPGTISNQTIL